MRIHLETPIQKRTLRPSRTRIQMRLSSILLWLVVVLLSAAPNASAEQPVGARLGSTATAAAPLHSEKVSVGSVEVTVGFYMWPVRADQSALLYVEGPIDSAQTRLLAVPRGSTNATQVRAWSVPDQVQKNQSWHEIQVGVRGTWDLHIQAAGQEGILALTVAGPPEIPLWLGWIVGLSPLSVLAYFVRTLRETVATNPLQRRPWWRKTSSSSQP